MQPVPGTVMDGSTPALTASAPVERRLDGTMDLIFSIQDLGDSSYDSPRASGPLALPGLSMPEQQRYAR